MVNFLFFFANGRALASCAGGWGFDSHSGAFFCVFIMVAYCAVYAMYCAVSA